MIVDFSKMSNSQHVLTTGQSGKLGSVHYKDQAELYLSGKYHTAWMDRSGIEHHATGILVLSPKEK
jgi:penicillin amidase